LTLLALLATPRPAMRRQSQACRASGGPGSACSCTSRSPDVTFRTRQSASSVSRWSVSAAWHGWARYGNVGGDGELYHHHLIYARSSCGFFPDVVGINDRPASPLHPAGCCVEMSRIADRTCVCKTCALGSQRFFRQSGNTHRTGQQHHHNQIEQGVCSAHDIKDFGKARCCCCLLKLVFGGKVHLNVR
jgi:hypothetical protein